MKYYIQAQSAKNSCFVSCVSHEVPHPWFQTNFTACHNFTFCYRMHIKNVADWISKEVFIIYIDNICPKIKYKYGNIPHKSQAEPYISEPRRQGKIYSICRCLKWEILEVKCCLLCAFATCLPGLKCLSKVYRRLKVTHLR